MTSAAAKPAPAPVGEQRHLVHSRSLSGLRHNCTQKRRVEWAAHTHSYHVPMATNIKLLKEGDALDTSVHGYSEPVGALMYLACCTRQDLSQPVGALARYMAAPTKDHWDALKDVLHYLCGTVNYGITYGLGSGIVGYCDADFAGDIATRRSTTGYIYTMNGGPSRGTAACSLRWLRRRLRRSTWQQPRPPRRHSG